MQLVNRYFPNVVKYWDTFQEAIVETLIIVGVSVLLVVTALKILR